jgi:2C-methyl-D-erythritol 2,4-cyclodiphosphate synthase
MKAMVDATTCAQTLSDLSTVVVRKDTNWTQTDDHAMVRSAATEQTKRLFINGRTQINISFRNIVLN